MIKLRRENACDSYHLTKTFLTCPQCLDEDWFYSTLPLVCDSCGYEWGNLRSMLADVRVRKHFHKKGEIS